MTGPATEAARDAGTERAAVRSFRSRLRRHRGLAAFGALVAVGLGLVIWGQLAPKGDVVPLSVNNAGPGGARAVAQILGDHGVRVHDVRDYDAAMADLRAKGQTGALGMDLVRQQDAADLTSTEGDN